MVTPAGLLLRGNNDEHVPQKYQEPDDRNNVEKLTIALPVSTVRFGSSGDRIATPYHVVVRGTYIPQGPQAFSLVVSGPAVALTAPGTCGDVPAPSGLDPSPDTSAAGWQAQISNLQSRISGLAVGLGFTFTALIIAVALAAAQRYNFTFTIASFRSLVKPPSLSWSASSSFHNLDSPFSTSGDSTPGLLPEIPNRFKALEDASVNPAELTQLR